MMMVGDRIWECLLGIELNHELQTKMREVEYILHGIDRKVHFQKPQQSSFCTTDTVIALHRAVRTGASMFINNAILSSTLR